MSAERIEALRKALAADPANNALRQMLAELLVAAGEHEEASVCFERLLDDDDLAPEQLLAAGRSAIRASRLQLAARLLEKVKAARLDSAAAELQGELERELVDDAGLLKVPQGAEGDDRDEVLEREAGITFEAVGGLEEVKDVIRRTIILPFQRPDLYVKYGRRAGGGALLYGPPGCGKTLIARATAGECDLPFLNLRIEDILDPYFGASEQRLHHAFEQARAEAPCVMFIDELDAIAFPRRKHAGGMGRSLVDQLLQEMDSIGSENDNLLVLAATNAPWDVDDALKRPGRFDRLLFVPPPDPPARRAILAAELARRPTAGIDSDRVADAMALFSGADIVACVERAVDAVIDQAMRSGEEVPIEQAHLDGARSRVEPTTLDWLVTARNFVEFANEAGRYDAVSDFLDSKEARAARRIAKKRGGEGRF